MKPDYINIFLSFLIAILYIFANPQKIEYHKTDTLDVRFSMTRQGMYGFFDDKNISYRFDIMYVLSKKDRDYFEQYIKMNKNKQAKFHNVNYVVQKHTCSFIPLISSKKSCTAYMLSSTIVYEDGYQSKIDAGNLYLDKFNNLNGLSFKFPIFLVVFAFSLIVIECFMGIFGQKSHKA